jgi:hypothetical protein
MWSSKPVDIINVWGALKIARIYNHIIAVTTPFCGLEIMKCKGVEENIWQLRKIVSILYYNIKLTL